jgi:hypothetical protein
LDEIVDKITSQDNAVSDNKQPTQSMSFREHLGPTGFKITLAIVVLAGLAVGAGISTLVNTFRRPPIVTPRHGAIGEAVLASAAGQRFRNPSS